MILVATYPVMPNAGSTMASSHDDDLGAAEHLVTAFSLPGPSRWSGGPMPDQCARRRHFHSGDGILSIGFEGDGLRPE
jgi:hypothetical protein